MKIRSLFPPSVGRLPHLFLVLVAGVSLAPACRIYVDKPAPAPPPPAVTYVQPAPPVRRHLRPAAPLPPATEQPAAPVVGTVAPPQLGMTENARTVASGSAGSDTSCLDTAASATPDCSQLHLAGSCAGVAFAQQKCAAYKQFFDPKVASDAVACLGSLGGKVCDQGVSNACGRTSLAKACPDTTINPLCGIAVTKCKATMPDCTSLLSGLNDDGKEKVAACIAGGCASGLPACVDALGQQH